ncbi:tetratricopeptide repeat protein [Anaeromyxobacter oryzae]|uniref:Tetratricopeptide repeat protein n=1 Tax=Anaeromyxobacter oryzae TaxID=2918170 RepID=A0ABM7WTD8_9BACT|nr:tetratricopeptide repeat protein [Anaeromyxobacter oryzae]BDG02727.1 hypothetical protein AMOR_17230 [Anaeromyxobacter oryzae]
MTLRRPLALALAALATGFSPFQAEQKDVRDGNERLAGGDPAAALRRYDAAEQAIGPRAQIEYDRGNALYRLGRHAEARDAWRRALDRGAGALGTMALQNVGNALAAMGDRDGAIAAYTEALRADPANEDARFDLEVLLRKKDAASDAPKPQGQGAEKQAKKGGKPDEPQDGKDGAKPSPEPRQGQDGQEKKKEEPAEAQRGEKPEQQQQQPQPGQQGQEPRETPADATPGDGTPRDGTEPADATARDDRRGGRPAPLSRQEAEKLLDALRARERNMPIAPGRTRKDGRRADAAKDW